jgi:hypothetical protein
VGILTLLCDATHPQEVRTEHLVPLASQESLTQITPSLRAELDLFADIENFRRARLFRGTDGSYVLEIEYGTELRTSHQRQALTAAGVDSLRHSIDIHRRRLQDRPRLDHSGRGELIFDQIILSLMLYGPAAPAILDLSGARPAVAAYMLTSAAGFYIPYRLTRNRDVTHAQRHLTQYGSTRGIAYGLLLQHLLTGQGDSRRTAAFISGTSVASGIAGFQAAKWRQCSRGQAELYGVMGDFGLLTGSGLAFVSNLYNEDESRRAGHAMTLVGAAGGLYAGQWLGARQAYTRGDAFTLRAGGLLGAIVAVPIINATSTHSARAHVAGALAGEMAGIAYTHSMLADRDLTLGEGLIITGGELAGLMLGLGLTYLADTGGNFDELVYFSSAAAGSLAGFTLTLRIFD